MKTVEPAEILEAKKRLRKQLDAHREIDLQDLRIVTDYHRAQETW